MVEYGEWEVVGKKRRRWVTVFLLLIAASGALALGLLVVFTDIVGAPAGEEQKPQARADPDTGRSALSWPVVQPTVTSGALAPWRPIAASPLDPRSDHTAVWTGTEMIIWGGFNAGGELQDGAAYDPRSNSWRAIAEAPRRGLVQRLPAVWTGDEMIVWGATGEATTDVNVGAVYAPGEDIWRVTAMSPLAPRLGHSLVWTGERMVAWGGMAVDEGRGVWQRFGDGAAYDPDADRWNLLAEGPLDARSAQAATVIERSGGSSEEMFLWGGAVDDAALVATDGATLDLVQERWRALPPLGYSYTRAWPVGRPTAAWAGGRVLIVAPLEYEDRPVGIAFEPEEEIWAVLDSGELARDGATLIVARDRIVVWGGYYRDGRSAGGGILYDPSSAQLASLPGPVRTGQSIVWTGRELIVWGGAGGTGHTSEGASLLLVSTPDR